MCAGGSVGCARTVPYLCHGSAYSSLHRHYIYSTRGPQVGLPGPFWCGLRFSLWCSRGPGSSVRQVDRGSRNSFRVQLVDIVLTLKPSLKPSLLRVAGSFTRHSAVTATFGGFPARRIGQAEYVWRASDRLLLGGTAQLYKSIVVANNCCGRVRLFRGSVPAESP